MTINDLDDIVQYHKSMGHGNKQAIVNINYGAAAHLASDTYTGLTDWCGDKETVVIQSAPLRFPGKNGVIVSYDLDEAEQEEVRIARESAPTVGLIISPV